MTRSPSRANRVAAPLAKHGSSFPDTVARFLDSISPAWESANQEYRNRLAAELFEEVTSTEGTTLSSALITSGVECQTT
jgi:hypothetical protein